MKDIMVIIYLLQCYLLDQPMTEGKDSFFLGQFSVLASAAEVKEQHTGGRYIFLFYIISYTISPDGKLFC